MKIYLNVHKKNLVITSDQEVEKLEDLPIANDATQALAFTENNEVYENKSGKWVKISHTEIK